MYKTILVTLDTTDADRAILDHIRPLAKLMRSRLILLHVADGWAARAFGADAVSPEVTQDRTYLEKIARALAAEGFDVDAQLAYGDPSKEITRRANECGCDLIAMSTHGHGIIADLFLGATANRVQHQVSVPVLLLRVS